MNNAHKHVHTCIMMQRHNEVCWKKESCGVVYARKIGFGLIH